MLATRVAKLTINDVGLIFQEKMNTPIITIIPFVTQMVVKLKLPESFIMSDKNQNGCEQELVNNLTGQIENI